jgi:hypothetical protein
MNMNYDLFNILSKKLFYNEKNFLFVNAFFHAGSFGL